MFNAKGFTLLELMITVAIVGIMSAIAYPSYQAHIMASRRADAKAALLGFANAMERFYTENNTYEGTNNVGFNTSVNDYGASPTIFASSSPIDGGVRYYGLTVKIQSASTYTLFASPDTDSAQAGDSCGILTLTQTGARGTLNNKGKTVADCW